SEKDTDPGFKAWPTTIGPNVLEYIPNSAKVAEMAQNGEAAIFPLTPTAIARLKKRGLPVEYAQPKEGAVVLMVGECVIANNSEPELANKLALYLLSAQAQAKALEFGGHFPSNKKVTAIAGEEASFQKVQGFIEKSVVLDWDVINATRPAFNTRWNRTVER
ncbi:MAG: extracellular solute-binding protein, partial [Comamonadaceae bacterium]